MKKLIYGITALFLVTVLPAANQIIYCDDTPAVSHRLPENYLPVLGCWFWHEKEFEPEGYKPFVDLISAHSPYTFLTASLRVPMKEVTDKPVHAQIKEAVIYAQNQSVSVVMDLDIRLARRAFQKQYPDELQQMLILHEIELPADRETEAVIPSRELNDHYTSRTTPYISLQGALVRVYSYTRNKEGLDPGSLKDITAACKAIEESSSAVKVRLPAGEKTIKQKACVIAAFTHLAADVFAPHLLYFQREILRGYADVPLAGACKDEWGFPPCFDGNPAKDQFWYSKTRAEEYRKRTNGRDLIFDCLLMSKGIQSRERERILAINHFMEMSWQRNGAIEQDFYCAVKEIFGATAMVATHPTWWPYPDSHEMMKNGLDWWVAKRDWAQTDELTPFAVRTALAKKWKSPVWYNMFYSSQKAEYEKSVWSHALAGGRVNYHPLYPHSGTVLENSGALLQGSLMQAESRIRLLNTVTQSALDCPVAVIFGHASAMNWAGPSYNSTGMDIADALWQKGYPADLIPSSEIENNNLSIDQQGYINYGSQRYAALVLYHPEFSRIALGDFIQKAGKGKTALFRIGNWTQDFDGNPIDGGTVLPKSMALFSSGEQVVSAIYQALRDKQIEPVTPAASTLEGFDSKSASPSTEGYCRLIDGTVIHIAGTGNIAGDPIQKTFSMQGHTITIDAVGVAAIRLSKDGKVEALAAGSLKYVKIDDFELSLPIPIDLAFGKDKNGTFHGVVQDYKGAIPDPLLKLTRDWRHLASPPLIPQSWNFDKK